MKRVFLVFTLLLLLSNFLFSQGNLPPGTYTSTNKKAIEHFKEARKCLESKGDLVCAEKNLETF